MPLPVRRSMGRNSKKIKKKTVQKKIQLTLLHCINMIIVLLNKEKYRNNLEYAIYCGGFASVNENRKESLFCFKSVLF